MVKTRFLENHCFYEHGDMPDSNKLKTIVPRSDSTAAANFYTLTLLEILQENMEDWGWRIPFVIAIIPGTIAPWLPAPLVVEIEAKPWGPQGLLNQYPISYIIPCPQITQNR
jgi:hypothetical protein